MNALQLCHLSAGVFFTIGLLTGVWKYLEIIKSKDAVASEYVSTLHRAALLYSFATMLLAEFTKLSQLADTVEFYASFFVIVFFTFAQMTYLIHAILKDTDNQFKRPYRIGSTIMSSILFHGLMILLILAETGGFLVLFWGYASSL